MWAGVWTVDCRLWSGEFTHALWTVDWSVDCGLVDSPAVDSHRSGVQTALLHLVQPVNELNQSRHGGLRVGGGRRRPADQVQLTGGYRVTDALQQTERNTVSHSYRQRIQRRVWEMQGVTLQD